MTTISTPSTLNVTDFRTSYLTILEEIFENVHGFVLDPAESMFETLATISAADASAEVAPGLAPIVAQVNHVVFLIDAQLHAYEGGERSDGVLCSGEVPGDQVVASLHWLRTEERLSQWFIVGND